MASTLRAVLYRCTDCSCLWRLAAKYLRPAPRQVQDVSLGTRVPTVARQAGAAIAGCNIAVLFNICAYWAILEIWHCQELTTG